MATRKSNNVLLYDQYGKTITPGVRASLYPNPSTQPFYRTRYYGNSYQDTFKAVDVSTRKSLVAASREIANQLPNVATAIEQQSEWVVGDGWRPRFYGEDQQWGKAATDWLWKQWFPIFNTLGPQYDFRQSMKIVAKSLVTDGDVLMVFLTTQSGFPLIRFVPTHHIGNRLGEKTVKDGSYKDLRMFDGVVVNDAGRPVAYRITGDKPEDDYFIPSQSSVLIFEPNTFSEYRGIPKLTPAILDTMTSQDVEVSLQRCIRHAATFGMTQENDSGEAPVGSYNDPSLDEITGVIPTSNTAPVTETLFGGEMLYLKAGSGKLTEFNSTKPSPNTMGYLQTIEDRILASIKWNKSLLDPSKQGGAGFRGVVENANKGIADIQNVLYRPFKLAVVWGLARAMDISILEDNSSGDFYDWDFDYPTQISVDQGYDRAADLNDYKAGLITARDITAKYGRNIVEVRNQKDTEVTDLYDRARVIHTKYPEISFDKILSDLSTLSPNPVTAVEQGGK